MAKDGGGGGGLVGASSEGRGRNGTVVSGIYVTTFGDLIAGGCSSDGLVRVSDPRPMERLGEPVAVPVTFVEVDRPWRISMAKISENLDRSKAPGYRVAG